MAAMCSYRVSPCFGLCLVLSRFSCWLPTCSFCFCWTAFLAASQLVLHLLVHLFAFGLGFLDESVELGLVGDGLLDFLVLSHDLVEGLVLLLSHGSLGHKSLDEH